MRAFNSKALDIGLAILVLGSIWGLVEVLGGALSTPYRSGILMGAGFMVMGVALSVFKRAWILPGMVLVTVLCKQLVVPLLHVPPMCMANSCLAIAIGGSSLAGLYAVAGKSFRRVPIQIGIGASAALLSSVVFLYMGLWLAPCPYLLSFSHAGGLLSFVKAEGVIWAPFTAALLPVGYWVGGHLRTFEVKKPLYYPASAAITAVCWLASGFAIVSGI